MSAQLRLHLQNNNIEDPFQSAYRPSHSVETAIVCIQDDVLRSLDARKHVALVLLDLSAAFDTIDHCILLEELHRIGVRGDALRWMSSYLTDRTHCVSVDDHLLVHGPEATFSEIGTTQRDKGSYVFFDRSVYVDNEMR